MDAKQKNRLAIIQQGAESIRNSNLLSDTFVSIALEDIQACQHVIRTILGMKHLKVIEAKGQYRLLNLTSKDTILDVLAQDIDGRLINIEIQRRDTIDHARRTRYYSSMIDKSSLDKGMEYQDLPDVYIIYISETDLWKAGKTVYPVKKTLEGTDITFDDGNHVIFVNASVYDGSETAKLMQYFKTADPDDMSQGDLSKRVHFLKCEQGGYDVMCEAAEKIYTQGIEQGIEQGLEQGLERGIEQGIEQGASSKARETAINLHEMGMATDLIAKAVKVSEAQIQEWITRQSV